MKKMRLAFLLCMTLVVACATSPTGRHQLMIVSQCAGLKEHFAQFLRCV